jgi:type 1 fimbria pilin
MKFKLLTSSILLLSSAFMTEVYAQCTPKAGFTTTDIDMTLGRIVIQPSDPVGKVLKKAAIPYARNDTSIYSCTSAPTIKGILTQNPTLSSLGNFIYNTNIPGIGIRLSRTMDTSDDASERFYPYSWVPSGLEYPVNIILAAGIFNIEIIKTAAVTGSGPISPGQYTTHYFNNNVGRPSLTTSLKANAITIASSSCEIQGNINKVVTLPTVTRDKFKGIGTTTGEQNFNFDILCNGGQNPTGVQASNNISLSFDYIANSDLKSIVNSAPTNTAAKGVSIQLVNKYKNANTVINKGSVFPLGTVNSNQTLIYNIPLTARYIQTAQTVTPGKVRGLATMTIEYD